MSEVFEDEEAITSALGLDDERWKVPEHVVGHGEVFSKSRRTLP